MLLVLKLILLSLPPQKTFAVDLDVSSKLTEIRNARMTKADAQVWDDNVKESGLTPSKFFRKNIIEYQTMVVNEQKKILSRPADQDSFVSAVFVHLAVPSFFLI